MVNFDIKIKKEHKIKYLAGVDEVGRGPVAGPVTACAVIMNDHYIDGIADSKKLSEKKREKLYDLIKDNAITYSVVHINNKIIDEINILEATKQAMKEAIMNLKVKPDLTIIDAVDILIPEYTTKSYIKGDDLSYTIACASILAKVERDRLMKEYAKQYPNYDLEQNKGYGTAKHMKSIEKFGLSDIHRKSFLKKYL